jgi:hypothetical protein
MRVIVKIIVVLVGALGLPPAEAAPPKQTGAFGVALDATPDFVRTFLAASYRPCSIARSVYRKRPEETAPPTAALAINPGLAEHDPDPLGPCKYSPAGDGLTDAIDARFAHPEVDGSQRLYFLEAFRVYPDVVYSEPPRVRTSFDDVRNELFRTYGKPIEERRERIASSAANFAKSLGVAKSVKREDYRVRYLWAAEGRLPDVEHEDAGCDCAGRYAKAVIEISRSPSTMPANKFYALSVRLIIEDPDLRRRQAAWNGQWQQQRQ